MTLSLEMVSTMEERSDRSGICVSASMMEDVPSLMTIVRDLAEPTWRGLSMLADGMGWLWTQDEDEREDRLRS